MKPQGTQNHKNLEKGVLQKTTKNKTAKSVVLASLELVKMYYFFVGKAPPKSQ